MRWNQRLKYSEYMNAGLKGEGYALMQGIWYYVHEYNGALKSIGIPSSDFATA